MQIARRATPLKRLLLATAVLLASGCAVAQSPDYQAHPRDFVRAAIYNELHAHAEGDRYMWKDTEHKPKGTTTKLMIETNQGVISRVISLNGHPLNAQERAQDDGRVNRLLTDPGAMRKKQQEQKDDEAHAQKLLASIPDAFIFTYAGVEHDGNETVHYTFAPDPRFVAPNHEARVLEGMKGDLFIDLGAKRIAKIDAALFQPVDFGWGILGRLDRGGRFLIEQRCVGGSRWETTHSVLHFTGKALMFKNISIQEDETLFDFQKVSRDLSVAQGIDTLKKADDMVAVNGGGSGH